MGTFETLPTPELPEKGPVFSDYDGPLVDSLKIFNLTVADILDREPASPDELEYIRGLSVPEIKKHLHITPWQIFQLLRKTRKQIASRMTEVEMVDGMPEVIKGIHESGREFHIVSSNSTKTIENTVNKYDIGQYVTEIHGGISLMGKANYLRRLIRKEKLDVDNSLYVGDEVRDIQATRKVGMRCIAVAWGYNTPEALKAHNPYAIVSNPAHLGELL